MKKTLMLIGCTVFSIGLAGCGANNDNAANNDGDGKQRVQTLDVNRGPANEGRDLRVEDNIERQVEQMQDVQDAHVIVTGNRAYVAVRLGDNTGNGNNRNNGNNMDDNGNATINNAMDGNGRTFADNGRVTQDQNGAGDNGIIDGQGDAGIQNRQNAGTADNQNAGTANNQNTGTDNRLNRNAYSEADNAFEKQIARQVRKADQNIKKVYVSVDNNTYDRMGTFADDIRNNRNRDGMFEDFNNTVNDLFRR